MLGADLTEPAKMTLETQVRIDGLTQGLMYRIRYRAINQIGYGEWSDIAFERAANVPTAPPAPILTSVDET